MDGPKQAKPLQQNRVKVEDWGFLSLSPIKTLAHVSLLIIACLGRVAIHSGLFSTCLINYVKAAWKNTNGRLFLHLYYNIKCVTADKCPHLECSQDFNPSTVFTNRNMLNSHNAS